MSIDITKIEVGDEVTVRGFVTRAEIHKMDPIRIKFAGVNGGWISAEDILTHTPKPRPLKAGDRVISPMCSRGVILWTDGEVAVVCWEYAPNKTLSPVRNLRLLS